MATVFKRGGRGNRTGKYYITYRDHTGKRITRSSGTTDKAAASRIAAKLESDAALRRDGVIDPTLDAIGRESQRPIAEHVADFRVMMEAAGRTKKHTRETIRYIREIAQDAGWQTAADIEADGVNHYAGQLKERNLSARSVLANVSAVKAFTKWLAKNNKILRDPLVSVSRPSTKADRRHVRRMLLPDEWQWLRMSLADGTERHDMPASGRLLLYQTAIQTGLRHNELRSLTRSNLFLNSRQPYITCKAGNTKNRKPAKQYISRDLADALADHAATKAPAAALLAMPRDVYVPLMLQTDLEAARRLWLKEAKHDTDERMRREQSDFLTVRNHDGAVLDFHALRHTCGAWLSLQGAHPKVIQTVMRHSSITLTMDTYGHLFPGQEAEAATNLGSLLAEQPTEPEEALATGTDDQSIPMDVFPKNEAQRQAQRAGRGTEQLGATTCNPTIEPPAQPGSRKPLISRAKSNPMQPGATQGRQQTKTTHPGGNLIL